MTDKLATKDQSAPEKLIAIALQEKAPVEALEKLMALQERHEANEARKAYHEAMAKFKADPPTILKSKVVDFTSRKTGERTKYQHAGLAEAAVLIGKALSKHGLSAAWRTQQREGNSVKVTCEITHVLGHSERTSLSAPPDGSGTKNSIQAIASTVTYLERYTLLALTGLAAQDMDDDGMGVEDVKVITNDQALTIHTLIKDNGRDEEKFNAFFGIKEIGELPAKDYARAVAMIEAKKTNAK